MSADQTFDYESLAQDAMRGVVRTVLKRVLKHGLPGDHHFYIAFNTRDPGVSISPRLKQKYPEEMTIVMQHRFWDLQVTNERFEIKLTFDNIPERLVVPYKAIKVFFDPSVPYGLQFEDPDSGRDQIESIGQAPVPTIVDTVTGLHQENLTRLHPRERDGQPARRRPAKSGACKPPPEQNSAEATTVKSHGPDEKLAGKSKKKQAEAGLVDTATNGNVPDDADTAANGRIDAPAKASAHGGETAALVDADDGALQGDNDLPELNGAPPRLVSEDPTDDEFMTDGETDLEKVAQANSKAQAEAKEGDDTADGDFVESANVVSLDSFRKK